LQLKPKSSLAAAADRRTFFYSRRRVTKKFRNFQPPPLRETSAYTSTSNQASQSSEFPRLQNERFYHVSHFIPIGIALTALFG
jgi:hypothetical protein